MKTAARSFCCTGVAGGWRAQITTSAPSLKKRVAMPRPMPWHPPVTITTLRDMSSCMANLVGRRPASAKSRGASLDSADETCSTLSAPAVQPARLPLGWRHCIGQHMPISHAIDAGIAEVVMNNPPVNALDVAGWHELASLIRKLGEDPAVRVLVLRAEGRGFNAGVDIKEMQRTPGFEALLGANRGCAAAFAAVYECEVPVIAAVHGYCLGGGIGLVGNA